MKYIITEEQHRRLIESDERLVRMVQRSIDKIIGNMRVECEEDTYLAKFKCRVLEITENIKVDEVRPDLYINNNQDMISHLYLTFNVLSKKTEDRFGIFFYDYLQKPLEQRLGLKFVVRINVNKITE